jgi:pimeloyl-ACP methyl ester carboxylesterase
MTNAIEIKTMGSFSIGGHRVSLAGLPTYEASMTTNGAKRLVNPNGEFWTGQMYVSYVKLAHPKAPYPLLLWHGGGLAGSCWESTPDGREGWQPFFLRAGHDVYVSDAVERGRASWSRYPEIYKTEPVFRTYKEAWESMRVGPHYDVDPAKRKAYAGSQFPVEAFDQAMMAAIPRWSSNNEATLAAYGEYVQKVGPCVIIVHSQGCSFAAHTALKYPHLIKGLVFLEPSGMPDPDSNDLSVLQNIPQLYVWGDNLNGYPTWNKSLPGIGSYYKTVRAYYERLQQVAKNVSWIELPDIGITGNTHMLIQDRNTLDIARIVQNWFEQNGLG